MRLENSVDCRVERELKNWESFEIFFMRKMGGIYRF